MNDEAKILVSACLLGEPVRYDGQCKALASQALKQLLSEDRVIAFCPEVAGGLSTPREPAEIQSWQTIHVLTASGHDVTKAFQQGAEQTLKLCQQHAIRVAVLTELSPSCGSSQVYDGSFRREQISGAGITALLLRNHGIKIFSQYQTNQAITELNRLG